MAKLITEEEEVIFKEYTDLSYLETYEENIKLYVKDELIGEIEVFTDKENENVEAVGDVPLQRTNFIHALSCGILPTACYRIVLFFVRWA